MLGRLLLQMARVLQAAKQTTSTEHCEQSS